MTLYFKCPHAGSILNASGVQAFEHAMKLLRVFPDTAPHIALGKTRNYL